MVAIKSKPRTLIPRSLDTECTGLDIIHGCKPFMVSTCDENENFHIWEWDVNPLTREPIIPPKEIKEIQRHVDESLSIIHNSKFDVSALESIGVHVKWDRVQDTLPQHHTLSSSSSHKLKDIGLELLDIDDLDQQELRDAVNHCRQIGKQLGWRIAGPHDPHFPAVKRAPKDGWWVMDMWLPRAVAKHKNYPKSHPYWTVCRKYNLLDDVRCMAAHILFQDGLEHTERKHLYDTRLKVYPITYNMEKYGVTISLARLETAKAEFTKKALEHEAACLKLSKGVVDNIDSGAQIREAVYGDIFKLPCTDFTSPSTTYPDGQPSVDKEAIEKLMDSLPPKHPAYIFLDHLGRAKKNYKAVNDLTDYKLRGIPRIKGFISLHGSFNPTGTDTTRFSSSNPNLQNICKKQDIRTGEDYNIRRVFGPTPGREWYSIDYSNIELRIFAYESGDEELIAAFETGYSVHLIIAKALYTKEWTALEQKLKTNDDRVVGKEFKKLYESTWYQWVKNGNFSLIYGAGVAKADATYHVKGAHKLIRKRFPLINKFMQDKNDESKEYGFVTCLGGYCLEVPQDRPHVAVNYFVQGSAGWCMTLAMIRVQKYLDELNNSLGLTGYDGYYMNLTIHDELDFDFPKHPRNKFVISKIAKLMEQSGTDIGVPCPVEVERHVENWAEGVVLAL